MPAVINGVEVPNGDTMMVMGEDCDEVIQNGEIIWFKAVSGEQIFDGLAGSYGFVVPRGVRSVNICLGGGGGGGGASFYSGTGSAGRGGFAGTIVSVDVPVTPNETIVVILGSGGAGGFAGNGSAGGLSSFGDEVASGGAGGTTGFPGGGYDGNGGERETCAGTFNDGVLVGSNPLQGFGGQAGVFGNGGDGRTNTTGLPGGRGAGGGGAGANNAQQTGGRGGDGWLKVTWGDEDGN